MAITPKKVSVTGTNTTLDSTGTPSIAWTESSKAGSNVFNVDKGTTTATLALTGTSGDVVKINGYSGDYSATLSGTKLTLQSNSQTVTVTLAKASTVKFTFADGDKVVDTAAAKLGAQTLSKVAVHVDGVTVREAKAVAEAKTALDKATADAKTALDAAVKKALTDTSGKLYTTVDDAIKSNDTDVINAAISTATGSKATNVADLTAAYTPTFSVSADSAVSEGSDAIFTVKLSVAASVATTVNIGLTPTGGATAGTDYNANGTVTGTGVTASGITLTFAAGATSATLKFPVLTDTVSPEPGEGLTLALTAATGSVAKVSATAATSTINITDVAPQATPAAVNITAANNSATATAGADTFNIAAGEYKVSIAGFGTGDTLVFAAGTDKGITNLNANDGNIIVKGSLNSQQVEVTLTGVSTTLDAQISDWTSFTKAFAVVGPSTTTSISSTAKSGTGTSGVDTFNIAAGEYEATINGFAASDKLAFASGASKGIKNTSATDGNIDVTGSLNNQLVTIHLTGVSTDLDAKVFDVASFNTAFGTGSLV